MRKIDHCHVMGPFNSGTTLMFRYQRRLYDVIGEAHDAFWKHSMPPDYESTKFTRWETGTKMPVRQIMSDTLFICMVRLPYFWLASTSRSPYGIGFTGRHKSFSHKIRCPVTLRNRRYSNLVTFWNHYYSRVHEHIETKGQLRYVRLDHLVNHPERTLEDLKSLMDPKPGVSMDEVIEQISNRPSKKHNSYGREAKEKYRIENVAKMISGQDLDFINSQLDAGLMKKFGFPFVWTAPVVG
jgi:hypothetical protein